MRRSAPTPSVSCSARGAPDVQPRCPDSEHLRLTRPWWKVLLPWLKQSRGCQIKVRSARTTRWPGNHPQEDCGLGHTQLPLWQAGEVWTSRDGWGQYSHVQRVPRGLGLARPVRRALRCPMLVEESPSRVAELLADKTSLLLFCQPVLKPTTNSELWRRGLRSLAKLIVHNCVAYVTNSPNPLTQVNRPQLLLTSRAAPASHPQPTHCWWRSRVLRSACILGLRCFALTAAQWPPTTHHHAEWAELQSSFVVSR